MSLTAISHQQKRIDFEQRINEEKDPIKKVILEVEFLGLFVQGDSEKYIKQVLNLARKARKMGLQYELAHCYRMLAMHKITLGDMASAKRNIKASEKIALAIKDDMILSQLYRLKFIIHVSEGKISEGMDNITQCIAISERNNLQTTLMSAYVNIAELIANHMQDYDRSLGYLKKSLAIATALNKPFTQSGALLYIAEMYLLKEDYPSCKKRVEQALEIITKNNFTPAELRARMVLGGYYKEVRAYSKALKEYFAVEQLALKVKDVAILQFVYAKMAEVSFFLNRLDDAEKYIRKSEKYGNKNRVLLDSNNLRWLLSRIMAKKGDYKKAWEYLRQSEKLKEEIYRQDSKKKMEIMTKAHQSEILTREKVIAEQSAQHRMDFLANMSHEIRSPMNAVLGISNILLKRNPENENTGYLRTIVSSSESLLGVINDILDISKIDAGKLDIVSEEFSVQQVIENVFAVLKYKAEEKRIEFSYSIDEKLAPAYTGDGNRLHQILMNLLGNAVKFTTEGAVQLQVTQTKEGKDGHLLRFEVTDTGTGMTKEQLGRIFGRFEQAEKLTTRRFGGTGLGLNISKKLVELMGGRIFAESKAGKGSVFTFELSLKPLHKTMTGTTDRLHQYVAHLQDKTFLIADDNKVNLQVLEQTITGSLSGATVVAVNNGQEVLEQLNQRAFDFLITDLHMPVLDGLKTVQHIKMNMPAHHEMRIVALTATISFTDKKEIKKLGFDAWMSKPFKEVELFQTLHGLL